MKETIVLSVLNVALPTIDVYSDLGLIANFFVGSRRNPFCDRIYNEGMLSVDEWWGINERRKLEIERLNCYFNDSVPTSNVTYTSHYGWGTMMLVPFLLNYFICWYVWATTDKRKAVSWVATLLSFYPQYIALKTIYQIWVSPQKGLQKKRRLERDLIQMEVFYEAVPSTLVMTYLLVRAMRGAPGNEIIYNAQCAFWVVRWPCGQMAIAVKTLSHGKTIVLRLFFLYCFRKKTLKLVLLFIFRH